MAGAFPSTRGASLVQHSKSATNNPAPPPRPARNIHTTSYFCSTMKSIPTKLILFCLASLVGPIGAFTVDPSRAVATAPRTRHTASASAAHRRRRSTPALPITRLDAAMPDLDVVGLVAGQENYGLAIVALGEAVWSFAQAPSFSHAKVLVPASIAAVVLFAVSGPMITSGGDAGTVALGLEIATGVSILLGARRVLPSFLFARRRDDRR